MLELGEPAGALLVRKQGEVGGAETSVGNWIYGGQLEGRGGGRRERDGWGNWWCRRLRALRVVAGRAPSTALVAPSSCLETHVVNTNRVIASRTGSSEGQR